MIAYSSKKSVIFNEFSLEKSKEWFGFTQKSFMAHIDTLYYVMYPKVVDWVTDKKKFALCDRFRILKDKADLDGKSIFIFPEVGDKFKLKIEMRPYFGFGFYRYHFGVKDMFDCFIAESVPNISTPSVFVQLRSGSLWLDGVTKCFDLTCLIISAVFDLFGIKFLKVQENRFDYAFHTNYMQDLINFFPEKHLSDMQVSQFARWHKEGSFNQDFVSCDYFTLGRRKSNNVFFRVYNKSKEVVEMGYKQFFIPLWYKRGLISKYDMYVMERAFKYGSWSSVDKARCEFYYDYGTDYSIRNQIYNMFSDLDTPSSAYKAIADIYTPALTLITNVEFQTKRKFYDRLPISKIPVVFKEIDVSDYRYNMYRLLEQVPSILNFLTCDTVRFVKYKGKYKYIKRSERPYADWWERLRSAKQIELENDLHIDYYRDFQKRLNFERSQLLSLNKLAKHSAYIALDKDSDGSTLINDVYDFLGYLNDNDIAKYYNVRDSYLSELRQKFKDGGDDT